MTSYNNKNQSDKITFLSSYQLYDKIHILLNRETVFDCNKYSPFMVDYKQKNCYRTLSYTIRLFLLKIEDINNFLKIVEDWYEHVRNNNFVYSDSNLYKEDLYYFKESLKSRIKDFFIPSNINILFNEYKYNFKSFLSFTTYSRLYYFLCDHK